MANITIRNLPGETKESLRVQAAKSGVSLEAYARYILQQASNSDFSPPLDILKLADKYFSDGVDLKLPGRGSSRGTAEFE